MPTPPPRVAIVEDDDLVAMALAAMVKEAGAVVVATAATYEAALGLVEGNPPCDMAFIDLHLRGQASGVDLAHRAVAAGLSVVVVTGSASLPDGLTGAGLLLKPFSGVQVAGVIRALKTRDAAPA